MGFPWRQAFGFGARDAGKLACAKEVGRLEEKLATAEKDRDYWKVRAETLIDAALAKNGHTPVMTHVPADGARAASMASLFGGLSVKTINTKEGDARS